MNMVNVLNFRGNMDKDKLDKITTIQDAIKKHEMKEIDNNDFSYVLEKFGAKPIFWDQRNEPNPLYKDNEKSRVGFKWNPFNNQKGNYYQVVIKKAILAAIDMIHSHTIKKYDNNQFVYDDIKLIELDSFAKAYIDMHFSDMPEYKRPFMHKVVDIVHGTIAKEDIFYRTAYFDFINKLIKQYPNGFELTPEEKENLKRWHIGIKKI